DQQTMYWPGAYGAAVQFEKAFQEITQEFNQKLSKKGWLILGWPKEYGGENSFIKQAIFDDLMGYYRVPCGDVGIGVSGPTIIKVGSEEMKKEWLPRIASCEATFFLGYSEPDAGSDLAALRTTAIQEGDHLIVNGQKIWSSGGHVKDYAWLLARTDPDAGKYRGTTLMIVDARSPGVTINPIINMVGVHSFNEVFFDNVKVPVENVVGEIGQGFYNVMLALEYERILISAGSFRKFLEELVAYVKETKSDGHVLAEDPRIRMKVATAAIEIEALYNSFWHTVWMIEKGENAEIEASALKLFASELSVKLAGTAMDILGLYGPLEKSSKWAKINGWISSGYLDSISGPIGAGTSEVQRGIIATRGMGLPRA
ncbi:acyl-CoA dehydrogenase family protein, partial [Thermodesulfobacteriota bacterium]